MTEGVNVSVNELLALQRALGAVFTPRAARAMRSGGYISRLRGRGMDFAEVRNYQAGDDIRHMDWRVTARTGKAHTKLYHEERERPVFIVTDFSPSMFFGTKVAFKSVVAARLSALLAFIASQQGDRVGGVILNGQGVVELKPRARKKGILPLIKCLSDSSYHSGEAPLPLANALERLRRVAHPGSLIFILSDFYTIDKECERHLSRLQLHNEVMGFYIHDILEQLPPPPGIYAVTNGVQELLLDTQPEMTRKRYSEHFLAHKKRVQSMFLAAMLVEVKTDCQLPDVVHQASMLLRSGGRR